MFPLKLAVFFTALCFSVFSNLVCIKEVSGDDSLSSPVNCLTCSTCQNPCPPVGGYPLYTPPPPSQTGEYAAPSPPPPSTSPPPPSPQQPRQGKCPPGQYQCCQNPQGYSPPGQFPLYPTPPSTFGGGGYVPYPYGSASSSPLSILLTILMMVLLFSNGGFF